MIKSIKKVFDNKLLTGVEIGIFGGKHAESILKTLYIKRLYLVDPYEPYIQQGILHSKERQLGAFAQARERLRQYENKIVWILKTSEKAVKTIPDQLDFVYIDGDHNYPMVKKDIELYYPKVKSGGYLGGHDYEMEWFGVIKAVNEFLKKRDLELNGSYPSDWWIIKK